MSKASNVEAILRQAQVHERTYDWMKAADDYGNLLALLPSSELDSFKEAKERIGYCLHRAAFQAETREEFRNRVRLAAEAYEDAARVFEGNQELVGEARHCSSMTAYEKSWLASDVADKMKHLSQASSLTEQALDVYKEVTNQVTMGKVCNDYMIILADRLNVEWDAELRQKIIGEALEYGEKAIGVFSKTEEKRLLAQAYITTSCFLRNGSFAKDLKVERREELRQKALGYAQKSIEISENTNDAYLVGMSHVCMADTRLDVLGTTGLQEKQHFEKALQSGRSAKDSLLIANALFGLLYAATYSAKAQEDPEGAREEYGKLDEYWKQAFHYYSLLGYDAGIAMAYSQLIISLQDRRRFESSLEVRRSLLEKAVELGRIGLNHARLSGSMGVVFHLARALSVMSSSLAGIETDPDRKRILLGDCAKLAEESVEILKQISAASIAEPKELNLALTIWTLGRYQVELAKVEDSVEKRIEVLKKGTTNMKNARDQWKAWVESPWASVEKPTWFIVGSHELRAGDAFTKLYTLTGNISFFENGLDAFKASADAFDKANVPTRKAEVYWQTAKAYDMVERYSESAKNFESASEAYKLAAEKIIQLESFYTDYATFMQAWSEIEEAKDEHKKEEYSEAKKHYDKAAELHNSTEGWNSLGPNYSAWAKLDDAEDLSRREKSEEAGNVFQEAARLFVTAKKCIENHLVNVKDEQEKELMVNLANAAEMRREYCLGRTVLEEAKTFQRQGDHASSAERYGFATERFHKIANEMKNLIDRRELEPIVYLCQAWQFMARAEAEASPSLYLEASRLFNEAKEHSHNERARLLALGHSRFCKALEAGARFEDTRDATIYPSVKQNLEAAESYYLRANLENAASYARATHLLFDAYIYLDQAETDTNPSNKALHYTMTERLLQSSATLYMEGNHRGKSEQVARLLESIKEKKQLAVSLTELLRAPTITSTTTSFSTPTATREQPVGLERFERADVQANLVPTAKEARVGDDLDLEIELVNAGKTPASLMRIEAIIPKDFEFTKVPEAYRAEDSSLNMKGKRLNPLNTEEVRILAKALNKGVFTLKPRVLYTDETGECRSHEPKPVTITVRELGIRDWIKGKK